MFMLSKQLERQQSLRIKMLRINKWNKNQMNPVRRYQFSNSFRNEKYRNGLRGIAPFLFVSSLYLYFQESLLSNLLGPIQKEFLHYKTVVETNKNIHEMMEYKKKIYETFDPEMSLQYLWRKLERKLDDKSKAAFERILSALAQDKIKNIKNKNLQVISAHNSILLFNVKEIMLFKEIKEHWKH